MLFHVDRDTTIGVRVEQKMMKCGHDLIGVIPGVSKENHETPLLRSEVDIF
jgi:hypothetical protein